MFLPSLKSKVVVVPSDDFDQVYEWFDKRYPDGKLGSNIRDQLLKKTTNYPARITQFSKKPSELTNEDLFFSRDPEFTQFELYVEGKHEPPYLSNMDQTSKVEWTKLSYDLLLAYRSCHV